MGLRNCRECGHQISTSAKACPNCGAKQVKSVGVIGALFALFVGLVIFKSCSTEPGSGTAASVSSSRSASTPASGLPTSTVDQHSSAVTPAQGSWQYESGQDAMASKRWHTATVESVNTVNFGFPYSGAQHATLIVRRNPRSGLNVIFTIERGQITCDVYTCPLVIRFDDAKPQAMGAARAEDGSTTVAFLPSESAFVARLSKAKKVLVEASFYQEGSHVFEFDVDGFDAKRVGVEP